MPLQEHFRENVRRRRKELNLTQEALAQKLGVTPPYISQVETAGHSPSLEQVERFAKALDCSPLQLLLEPTPRPPAKKIAASA